MFESGNLNGGAGGENLVRCGSRSVRANIEEPLNGEGDLDMEFRRQRSDN